MALHGVADAVVERFGFIVDLVVAVAIHGRGNGNGLNVSETIGETDFCPLRRRI